MLDATKLMTPLMLLIKVLCLLGTMLKLKTPGLCYQRSHLSSCVHSYSLLSPLRVLDGVLDGDGTFVCKADAMSALPCVQNT